MNVEITLKNYRCFSDENPARIVIRNGFSAVVGVNNSGKSTILRFFYEFRGLFRMLSERSGNLINAVRGDHETFSQASSVLDVNEVFCKSNDRNLIVEIAFPQTLHEEDTKDIRDLYPSKVIVEVPRNTRRWLISFQTSRGVFPFGKDSNPNFEKDFLRDNNQRIIYLVPLWEFSKKLSNSLYIGAFRNAINIGADKSYFDISVGQAFINNWNNYKTGNIKFQNEMAYKVTESIRRIFNFKSLEINASADKKTLQVFVDGKSYRLIELGAGLTQFILVFVSAAISQPSFIFIDEPELNLHPALQLDFLTSLGSLASEGVLFATHSIGLARASADRIYTVQKDVNGTSSIVDLENTPRLSEFLGELSFSGYKELGFDKILLVEGSTDVRAIQQLLRLYKKEHQIVLMPLGGSQLINNAREIELQEICRITTNIYVLIDSERDKAKGALPKDRDAFMQICKKIGITHHALELRAIENYWSDRAVKIVKGEKYRALGPYELLKEASPSWAKSENWRIAREMTLQEVEKTDLGQFLATL